MELIGIRRYPVKAMAGESLTQCEVSRRGLRDDRWYAVTDAEGHVATGKNSRRFRRHDEVFEYGARMVGPDSEVEVYRHDATAGPWMAGAPDLDEHLSTRMGEPMQLRVEADVQHMDDSPVSLIGTASLDWFAAHCGLTVDERRLRANLVVGTGEPFEEETWTRVRVGDLDFDVVKRTTRCRMVDLAQNHLTDTLALLKVLGAEREAKLGVYLTPHSTGTVRVGDAVSPSP